MKYEEGDLIIKDGKWYVCTISGKDKALFYPKTVGTHCISGAEILSTGLTLRSDITHTLSEAHSYRENPNTFYRTNAVPKYPVVGKSLKCKPINIFISVLIDNYPKEAAEYLKRARKLAKSKLKNN